jgi:hypothetical protein
MTKSATEVMQEILFSAILDSLAALKTASKGVPNNMLRDLNALHANTTFADLPRELQAAITAGVRAAFTRLLREGYTVSSAQAVPPPPPRDRVPRHEPNRFDRSRRGPPPPQGGKGPKGPPRGQGRPGGKPKPRRP